jgi:alpha-glucosidase
MKYIGIWWGMHIGKYTWYMGPHHGATTENMKMYMDFAAKNGFGGVLAEGWNYGWECPYYDGNWFNFVTPYPDFDLADWVLSAFSAQEEKALQPALERAADAALAIIEVGMPEASNRYGGMK